MIALDRFIPPASGISLTDPSSINDRGETVIDGTLNGFMLVPCDEDHAHEAGCTDASEDTNARLKIFNRSLSTVQPSRLKVGRPPRCWKACMPDSVGEDGFGDQPRIVAPVNWMAIRGGPSRRNRAPSRRHRGLDRFARLETSGLAIR
jgi:hypothetical protein